MDALSAYRSDSEDEERQAPDAATGGSGGAAAPAAAPDAGDSDEEEDEEPVDPSDAFGLKASAAQENEAHRGPERVRVPTGRSSAPPQVEAKVRRAPGALPLTLQAEETSLMPAGSAEQPSGVTKTLSGYVEETTMSDFDFRNQQRTFDLMGYARDPSVYAQGLGANAWVGDRSAAVQLGGATMAELRGGDASARSAARALKKRRTGRGGDAGILEGTGAYLGPWAGWEHEAAQTEQVPVAGDVGPTAEELNAAAANAEQRRREAAEMEKRRQMDQVRGTEKSIYHGKEMYDYQGRTYMHIPTDAGVNLRGEPGTQQSYIPETCIHTFTGHTQGITSLRLFPGSGHLLLSGSMDTKVKLWDTYHENRCLRTFLGHSRAVRDVAFSPDGRRFLSAGFDRQMKLWDTETGACLKAFSDVGVPNCVRFHPNDENVFLAGMSDKRVLQYDIDAGMVVQEYDQHQGGVNTITFVDEDRRFVTTSDDKSIRAWDYDIPVVIKYIADPSMQSMPAVSLHPSAKWFACQSMDNQVAVFSADTFKQNRRSFRGHTVSGFACQLGFSPDGHFLSSGDSRGNMVFWDWNSGRLLKRLAAHKQAVVAHEWLPHETSKMVTGSWDGLIKLWT